MRASKGRRGLSVVVCVLAMFLSESLRAQRLNGFDLEGSLIPQKEIVKGGPPRDGIPALTFPKFREASEAEYLSEDDRVLGVVASGISKAYPMKILDKHEVVNDLFSGLAIVVTYCPLCGSGMSFRANSNGYLEFGVSGLLYNSDVLLYDRQSESLWSQIMMQAISGPKKGTMLELVPTANTTWADWKKRYPNTLVLSDKTGFGRNYDRDSYPGYARSKDLMFKVNATDRSYHKKARLIGIVINGVAKAYPFVELAFEGAPIEDNVGDLEIQVAYDSENRTAEIRSSDGTLLAGTSMYWFAWFAFHPETEVFQSAKTEPKYRKKMRLDIAK